MTTTNRILKYSLFQENHQKYICISFIYAIFSDSFNSSDHTVLSGVTISDERRKEAILSLQLSGQHEENHSQNSQSPGQVTFKLNSSLYIFLYYTL